MTKKAEFNAEEWSVVLQGPPIAGMMVITAERGGTLRESVSMGKAYDLHVWTITSGFPALSAHVLVRAGDDCHGKRQALERLLHERFGLEHTTLQVDHRSEQGLISIEPAPR